ncbi:MAG TPA: fumarylacetoacetate hydrolase family protein [Hymenobacter sp.]|jgi:fumarylacetoacetate (FAA) hydrolase|uniref:fumarylacetoacetate hydrolase family protein n=1 Tax=Hymenobacter sp. TaxID=1898978 RepID=UPI002ED7BE77
MKLITFRNPAGHARAGWLLPDGVVDMHAASQGALPADMLTFITDYARHRQHIDAHHLLAAPATYPLAEVQLLAPLPNPPSFRDFLTFETHIKNATARAGHPVPPEWYQVPVFYFSNATVMAGPGQPVARPARCERLDYELELAVVIGKEGRDIRPENAHEYILGYTILNDWTARDLQAQEMRVMLGPAKGKDFATSLGPYIATPDELAAYATPDDRHDLRMTATVNGRLLSDGNFRTVHYTFGQMLARASEDVTLYPGDVIGSGTVGWGCLMELGPETHRWLEHGDVVELEITGLGKLTTPIV